MVCSRPRRAPALRGCAGRCSPAALFQLTAYGALVSSVPSAAPSSRNCTPATPTLSARVRRDGHHPGTVAPAAGAVIDTVRRRGVGRGVRSGHVDHRCWRSVIAPVPRPRRDPCADRSPRQNCSRDRIGRRAHFASQGRAVQQKLHARHADVVRRIGGDRHAAVNCHAVRGRSHRHSRRHVSRLRRCSCRTGSRPREEGWL